MQGSTSISKVQRIDTLINEIPFNNYLVLFNRQNGTYYSLSQVWTESWNWLKDPLGVDELTGRIATRFSCSPERCKPELLLWLEAMAAEGLITVVYCLEFAQITSHGTYQV